LGKITSYKELIAYQKSYELVLLIYRLSATFPKEEMYGLSSQIRRCAVSIPSNIAEGYMRGSKEYVQFMKIALGSGAELETQISLCEDLGYLDQKSAKVAVELCDEVIKLLKVYILKITNR
jgi:four helix bundle protein